MNGTNKTLPIFWKWRIGFTAIATLWIGNSAMAQTEFVEQLPYETSCQSCDDVAQCGCDESLPPKVRSGLRCRTHRGKVCGVVSEIKQSAALLSHRESPDGDMGLHFPYQATQMYYYRRPYNHHHVPIHLEESNNSAARSPIGENLGYSNQIFDQVHGSVEAYLNLEGLENDKDGLLEYVDWKKHQQDRLAWEVKPKHEVQQRAEQHALPAPVNDEKQWNDKTSSQEVMAPEVTAPRDPTVSEDRTMLIRLQGGFSAHQRAPDNASAESP